ncbi:MAG TPA: TetR/AcrR family transcriptional regulator [Alloacidobacterium sp.]|nr:TetR/AcrR family transcriptional regulator [Alloacidobacterium sp.]
MECRQTGLSTSFLKRIDRDVCLLSRLGMDSSQNSEPRMRIVKVADQLFYNEGIRATGTEKIMALSEVAKATFYRHFESKDALVLAYLENRDQSFWKYLFDPEQPKDIEEALVRIHRLVNQPQTIGCPFLRVASEYPDPAHPFHCRVIGHKNKMLAYLTELFKPLDVDRKAVAAQLLILIDGALSGRLVYGPSKEIPLLASAKALLRELPPHRDQRRKR